MKVCIDILKPHAFVVNRDLDRDTFVTGGVFGNECPEGFCPMAWQDICIQASTLAGGGKVYGVEDVHIACCNDGVRPVVFRLEMIEDGESPQ